MMGNNNFNLRWPILRDILSSEGMFRTLFKCSFEIEIGFSLVHFINGLTGFISLETPHQ